MYVDLTFISIKIEKMFSINAPLKINCFLKNEKKLYAWCTNSCYAQGSGRPESRPQGSILHHLILYFFFILYSFISYVKSHLLILIHVRKYSYFLIV